MEVQYLNEHLWVGQVGHLSVIIGFVAALLSIFAYGANMREANSPKNGWLQLGRGAFVLHGLAAFTTIFMIFYLMLNHLYEYHYAWDHTSDDLPFKFVFAAFWEGQEGSFLLWAFWNVILGFILMRTTAQREAPIMVVMSVVQAILMSMLLGFYVGEEGSRFGSSPFTLMRDMNPGPIFQRPDYLKFITGKGLNALLQNYWMTIHPPTLFLGFASTVVPFAFAIAGIWQRDYSGWLRPALPWALFSAGILGTGIAMGGVWAYEALSFGGYWAWDPVENSSLVPWLVMLAGLHMNLVARNTGHSIRATFVFYILSFITIVYSTFLTRSGILGETSVHAFTEMGLEVQLILFLVVLSLMGFGSLIYRWREIPNPQKEESIYSREFWMFIGSLVLIFSSILITFTTSIPVFDKILAGFENTFGVELIDGKLSPPKDIVGHHNRYQIWIGLFMGLLMAVTIYLRYKATEANQSTKAFLIRHIVPAFGISLILSIGACLVSGIVAWQLWLLLITSGFVVISNSDYIVTIIRNNLKMASAAISHVGFGVMMWGVVYSSGMKDVISSGRNSFATAEEQNKQANTGVLLPKGKWVTLKEYTTEQGVVEHYYEGQYAFDSIIGKHQYYGVTMRHKNAKGELLEQFSVEPYSIFEEDKNDGGYTLKASNPETKHYLSHDVFNVVFPDWAYDTPDEKQNRRRELDSITWSSKALALGDTFNIKNGYFGRLVGINQSPKHKEYKQKEGDIAIAAQIVVGKIGTDSTWKAEPLYLIRGNEASGFHDEVRDLGYKFRFKNVLPETNQMVIEYAAGKPNPQFLVLQSLKFPWINLVWLGTVMMMFGLLMAAVVRVRTPSQTLDL